MTVGFTSINSMDNSVFSLSHSSLFVRELPEKEMAEMALRSEEREGAVAAPPPVLLEKLKNYGQDHVFSLWDQLSAEERDLLIEEIEVCFLGIRSLSILMPYLESLFLALFDFDE